MFVLSLQQQQIYCAGEALVLELDELETCLFCSFSLFPLSSFQAAQFLFVYLLPSLLESYHSWCLCTRAKKDFLFAFLASNFR